MLLLCDVRGGGVLLYVKDTIPAYEIQLREEADCEEAIWCKLVTGHKTVTMGVVYRCPNITKESNEKIQNAIREVSKGDCIVMGDFNHGNIQWGTLESTGVEDQQFMCLPSKHKDVFVTLWRRSVNVSETLRFYVNVALSCQFFFAVITTYTNYVILKRF